MRDSSPSTGYAADLAALEARATALSDAVADAIHAVVPDPSAIRACGRVLGISKNLAWKMVHIAGAADLSSVLSAIPGPRGWRLALDALVDADCEPDLIDRLRLEIERFDSEIERRRIDRRTLAAMAGGGLDSRVNREEQRRLREQAMLANATVWGALAEASIITYLVTPSGEDDFVDLLSITSIRGLHRLSPGPSIKIHLTTSAYHDRRDDAVYGRSGRDEPPTSLAEPFCSPGAAAEIVVRQEGDQHHIHFEGAGTSATRPVDLVFVERLDRAAYTHARHPREIGTFGGGVLMPSRWAVLEVLVDRSIPWIDPPEAAAYSQVQGSPPRNHWSEVQRLPMTESAQSGLDADLPEELDAIRIDHHAVLSEAADRMGRSLADFTTHLVAVPAPVLASNIMLRWLLPERKGGPSA